MHAHSRGLGQATTDAATAATTTSSTDPTAVNPTSTNSQLIAGQNANKVQSVSTTQTNAILYGIGALAVGAIVGFALSRGTRRRRRR